MEEIRAVIDLDAVFCQYGAYYNSKTQDFYFYGVKKDPKRPSLAIQIPEYTGPTIQNMIVPVAPVSEPAQVSVEELTPEEKALVEQYLAMTRQQ